MSRKALHDLNPHQSDEYSSRNAPPSSEKQHHYYKRTHEGRMNSEPYGEKQQHYYQRSHEGRMNSESSGEKQQRYYQRTHEGRMNSEPYGEKQQRYYRRSHEGRMNSKPYGEKQQCYYNQRSHEGRMNAKPSVEEQQRYYTRGHDHSKCLLARKQRLERPPNFHPYLFLTEEERSSPAPSNKIKLNIVLGNDDWPVFDEDRYEESMLKLSDYMMKATAIFAKGIGKDHQRPRPQLPI